MKKLFTLLLLPFLALPAWAQNSETWNLERCISYAFAHNISIATSELQKETSENNLTQARFSRLPNLSASASQSFSNEKASALNAGLSSSITLFAGGQINKTIAQNKANVEQRKLQIEEAKNSIQLAILQAFVQSLYAKEAIDVAKSTMERSELLYQQTQVKFEVGAVSKKDLVEIQAQYAQSQYNVQNAENNYANQVLALKQLLELPPQTAFEIEIPTIQTDTITIPDLMETYNSALAHLPEMRSYVYQNRIDSLNVGIAKSDYLPTLSASAGINTNTYVFNKDESTDVFRDNYSLGVSLSYPIFTRWQRKTQVSNAKISQKQTALAFEADKKTIYKNIETAHINASAALLNEKVLTQMLEAARTSYELSYEQFLLGGISSIDLTTTQTAFVNAQLSLMQAKYYTVLYSQLLQFYGGKSIAI